MVKKTLKNQGRVRTKNAKLIFNPVLFWDVAKVDIKQHAHFIIARVLDFGDEKDLMTLRSLYPDREIIYVIKNRRGLMPKTALYWATYFKIPRNEIKCLKKY